MNKELRERLDIWFMLTKTQRKKLEAMGYDHHFLFAVRLEEFASVTKSKSLRKRFFWKLGVRDTLLAWLGAIVLMLVAVGLIFLDKVRFVI